MPWRNAPENFFSAVRGCPRSCARTNPWFRGQIFGGNVRKNRPLVPRSNIAGSWAQGGGGGYILLLTPLPWYPFFTQQWPQSRWNLGLHAPNIFSLYFLFSS